MYADTGFTLPSLTFSVALDALIIITDEAYTGQFYRNPPGGLLCVCACIAF